MNNTVQNIAAKDVFEAISQKKDCVLLDVRTSGEFARGTIQGSINIPVDQVESAVSSRIPEKTKTIYVFCLSGSRSIYAAETMVKLGFTNVYNMTSGLLAWRASGYPMGE